MEWAQRLWEYLFFHSNEEFIYCLFSQWDKPICNHYEDYEIQKPKYKRIRDACENCLNIYIQKMNSIRTSLHVYCLRYYIEQIGSKFMILIYPFSDNDLCVDLDILSNSFTQFILECIKRNMITPTFKSIFNTLIDFKQCSFDEEMDLLHNRANLRMLLLFRFFLFESLRSKNPIKQREKIFNLMIKEQIMDENNSDKDEFCKNYDHKDFIEKIYVVVVDALYSEDNKE